MNRVAHNKSRQVRPVLALGLVVLLVIGLALGAVPLWLGIAYAAMGLLGLAFYFTDKTAAEAGTWRVPEMQLHGLDLCCGIVGGLLGQALFRHKTSKPGFVRVTWLIVGAHSFGLIGLLLIHVKLN